ncbi:hypothetical protein UP09_01420 [Bradyrhizobium sp. LTSP885]|uniref:hypothetical protein n=1 Tax=Bradyrhizobium sp. LTSP885 TaxID=1619232 RepID=UPI0005C8D48B|nr:hypothetical protein [Bradyrhizobium sp. LTSP885]KJC51587.1 hypothetical protein UP09_01420 [Bradyrhizobium sp. LTSP885]
MIQRALLAAVVVSQLGVSAGLAQTAPAQPAPAGAATQITPAQTAAAETVTVSAGSIGLRTGYDSNPTDILGAHGSMFATETINYDYLRGSLQDGVIGLNIKVADTQYDPNVAAPSTNAIIAATGAIELAPKLTLRTTLTTTVDDSWARRSHAVQLRNRVEYDTTDFRIFANVDAGLNALNERNIFTLGGFLPQDENFATTTFLPGFAYKFGTGEIGTSVALSRVGYLDTDIFGLDRSHNIVQPNAFFSVKTSGVEVEGSVSPYFAKYDTTDFDDVRLLLYTAKAKYQTGAWTFGVGSSRTVQDTTLSFASLDTALAHEAAVSYKIDDKNAVSLLARYRRDDYLGTDLWSTTFLTGIDFAHDFGEGFIGTAGASVRQVRRPDEVQPWALNLQIGLQKRLDFGDVPKPAADKVADAKPKTVQ